MCGLQKWVQPGLGIRCIDVLIVTISPIPITLLVDGEMTVPLIVEFLVPPAWRRQKEGNSVLGYPSKSKVQSSNGLIQRVKDLKSYVKGQGAKGCSKNHSVLSPPPQPGS